MPVNIETGKNITVSNGQIMHTAPVLKSPLFFDGVNLTGAGSSRKSGLLNGDTDPKNISPKNSSMNDLKAMGQFKNTTKIPGKSRFEIPFLPVPFISGWELMKIYKKDVKKLTPAGIKGVPLYIEVRPAGCLIEKEGTDKKTIKVLFRTFYYLAGDMNQSGDTEFVKTDKNNFGQFLHHFKNRPTHLKNNIYFTADNSYIENLFPDYTDGYLFDSYIDKYSTHNAISEEAEKWQSDEIAREGACYLENLMTCSDNVKIYRIKEYFTYLETYPVPLNVYETLYAEFSKVLKDEMEVMGKYNLNLMLSHTLRNLENDRDLLPRTVHGNDSMDLKRYSPEQIKAIKTEEPLCLVQAGAGTGKSTTILGRIDYMISQGISPSDILVLSFTNAAADNIKTKNENLNSPTIASMIHEIHDFNYPHMSLSNTDTLINALKIYFPKSRKAMDFAEKLSGVKLNGGGTVKRGAMAELSNFIEENKDDVKSFLNTLKQTTLELEIIMCCVDIENMNIPDAYKTSHIIMDEVQDTSVYEFIYMIKFALKYKASLFMVGDASQTLFEFRNANPKALNLLESSGVFTPYQLNTNYRSNQEILDFANVALSQIEANQFANIRLRANSLKSTTEQSFLDSVTLMYRHLDKIKDAPDAMTYDFKNDIKKYIDDKLSKNEQVAFLSYARKDVFKMMSLLEEMYPGEKVMSLVSQKNFSNTVFSAFIARYWDGLKFFPKADIMTNIIQGIFSKLGFLVYDYDKSLPEVQKQTDKFKSEYGDTVKGWYSQFKSKLITGDEFLNNVKEAMFDFEIEYNAVKNVLISQKNEERKKADMKNVKLIVSTIHGAKGLEFDNVVVIHKNSEKASEETKRMYYVAFTRAKKTEFIYSYDTVMSPLIESNYLEVLTALHNVAPAKDSPVDKMQNKTLKKTQGRKKKPVI